MFAFSVCSWIGVWEWVAGSCDVGMDEGFATGWRVTGIGVRAGF